MLKVLLLLLYQKNKEISSNFKKSFQNLLTNLQKRVILLNCRVIFLDCNVLLIGIAKVEKINRKREIFLVQNMGVHCSYIKEEEK